MQIRRIPCENQTHSEKTRTRLGKFITLAMLILGLVAFIGRKTQTTVQQHTMPSGPANASAIAAPSTMSASSAPIASASTPTTEAANAVVADPDLKDYVACLVAYQWTQATCNVNPSGNGLDESLKTAWVNTCSVNPMLTRWYQDAIVSVLREKHIPFDAYKQLADEEGDRMKHLSPAQAIIWANNKGLDCNNRHEKDIERVEVEKANQAQ